MLQKEATVGRELRVESRRRMAAEVDALVRERPGPEGAVTRSRTRKQVTLRPISRPDTQMRGELRAFLQREQREKQARRRALHARHEQELEALGAALRRTGHEGAAQCVAGGLPRARAGGQGLEG